MPRISSPSSSHSQQKRSRLACGAVSVDSASNDDSSESEDLLDGICEIPLWDWPPASHRDPWPSVPTHASQTALSAIVIPPDSPSAICPCCLQPAHVPVLFPRVNKIINLLPVRDWICNTVVWEFFCIHCNLVFNAAVLNKIRTWVGQYIALDPSLKATMYIRGELLYATAPHAYIVPGLDGEHRHRPLAFLRSAVLDHPPPGHSKDRIQQRVAPWPADARSVLLAVCPDYTGTTCGCNACNERLTRKCCGLQAEREEPDSNYIIH